MSKQRRERRLTPAEERRAMNATRRLAQMPSSWNRERDAEEFCEACGQHKPCACDDMENDRNRGARR